MAGEVYTVYSMERSIVSGKRIKARATMPRGARVLPRPSPKENSELGRAVRG